MDIMDTTEDSSVGPKYVEALREKFLAGLTPFNDFAAAIAKHPKTLAKLNPPIVRIGRSVYVPDDQGRTWLLNGCKPLSQQRRRNRRSA
jgi:hypothetical protein